MRKILLVPIVVITVIMVSIATFVVLFSERGFREGYEAEWGVLPITIGSGSSQIVVRVNTSIFSETTTNWSITVEMMTSSTVFRNFTEIISKQENLNGLQKCGGEFSGYWMLWIDLLNITEMSSLYIPGNLVGSIPMQDLLTDPCWIPGPFYFEVDYGDLVLSDGTEKSIWLFYATNKDMLFLYDADTGLLLEAAFSIPAISSMYAFRMILLESNY